MADEEKAVMIRIVQGRLWDFPFLIPRILRNGLDVISIITNPKAYVAYHGQDFVSFCCVKDWGMFVELGNAYTPPRFRRRGHFRDLVRSVMKKHPTIYILTFGWRIAAAQRSGFRLVKRPPLYLSIRCWLANLLLWPFRRPWAVLKKEA